MNFETITLKDSLSSKKLVHVKPNQTVEEVLDILSSNNITSVPGTSHPLLLLTIRVMSEDGSVVHGFVDVLDLVAFLVETCIKPLTIPATYITIYLFGVLIPIVENLEDSLLII